MLFWCLFCAVASTCNDFLVDYPFTLVYHAVGGRFGLAASRVKRLGVVAVSLGLALVLPLLFFR